MDKTKIGKAVATGLIIAQLAVLDYCAWRIMRDGVVMDVTVEELNAASEAARMDMEGE